MKSKFITEKQFLELVFKKDNEIKELKEKVKDFAITKSDLSLKNLECSVLKVALLQLELKVKELETKKTDKEKHEENCDKFEEAF